jgi:hypothetical protein
MEMLAKVAAVGTVASGVVVASVLSYAVMKSVAEPRVRMGKTVAAFEAAAIKAPTTPLLAPMAEPPPAKIATPAPAAKNDLGSAISAALTGPTKKPMVAPPTPPPIVAAEPGALELGFKTPARESNLGERAVKSTSVHQTGGAERQRVATSDDARVHFDVDLAAPR